MRSEDDIRDQIYKAEETTEEGMRILHWPGMSYEEGVVNALQWVLGDDETPPMDEEDDE